ncbi:MAG: sodium:alanine symporter family protein [Bradymonadales bacterium]|nr:MAG: sodium:alanine symporter family protein [Bradymonadales bacterium]
MLEQFNNILGIANSFLWHDVVLYTLLATGLLFTFWSGFCQFRALTHGSRVITGKYDRASEPGAISHFQALSAALSATVGLGNIGGVAIAIALGGPGAVFWMWVVGIVGMALKTTEVTLAMLYRNTDERDNPHGGPMWVAKEGFAKLSPRLAGFGSALGAVFCITLLISAVTGGNMFQAWNVGLLTQSYFGVPSIVSGVVLAIVVGLVIIGGIKRIGKVAGTLVPFMCGLYVVAALFVLANNFSDLPEIFALIFRSAFNPIEAQGAFIGGTAASAFLFGMKRALFSNEAGQGSAPIAHSAARTSEPVREGVVAGLEPFIDTLVVCSITALVILSSGVWNRGPDLELTELPQWTQLENGRWSLEDVPVTTAHAGSVDLRPGDQVFMLVELEEESLSFRQKVSGSLVMRESGLWTNWSDFSSEVEPQLVDGGVFADYPGATLTGQAFDRVFPGLGFFLVPLAAWLFAISTMISWSYYGEQGIVYLFGQRWVFSYRLIYCLLIIAGCAGFIQTEAELDNLTGLGTGVMLFANIPIMLIFGHQAMKAYHSYIRRLKAKEF